MKTESANVLGSFERRTTTKSHFGHEDETWTEVCRGMLEIRLLRAFFREEVRQTGVKGSSLTHTVSTGYNPALLPLTKIGAMRIKVVGTNRIFNILGGFDQNEEHEFIVMDCVEGEDVDGQ